MPYNFDDLHTVYPYGAFALRIPRRWTCKEMTDGSNRWVCDEPNDDDWTASLWICLETFPMPPGRPAPSRQKQAEMARDIVGHRSPEKGSVENFRQEETENELYWCYEDTAVEDGDLLRFYWHRRAIYTDHGAILLLTNLVILDDNKDDPEFRALVAHVEREIRHAKIAPPDWQTPVLETRIECVPEGPTFIVPADWTMEREDEYTWWVVSPDERADLKIRMEFFEPEVPLSGTAAVAARQRELVGQVTEFLENAKPVAPLVVDDIWGGRLVKGTLEFAEDGAHHIAFYWYMCLATERTEGVGRYILSMEKALEATPLGRALIAHVDEQARSARLWPKESRAAPLSDWRDVAIADCVFFRLPLVMDVRLDRHRSNGTDGARDETWYAWFPDKEITASLFVSVRERMVLKYEDGDPVDFTEHPEIFEAALEPWTKSGAVAAVEHGWLKYERFDDPEDRSDEVDPGNWRTQHLRNDHWNYMVHIPGGFLDVDWLLLSPHGSEDPVVLALIAQMDAAVRAARFTRP